MSRDRARQTDSDMDKKRESAFPMAPSSLPRLWSGTMQTTSQGCTHDNDRRPPSRWTTVPAVSSMSHHLMRIRLDASRRWRKLAPHPGFGSMRRKSPIWKRSSLKTSTPQGHAGTTVGTVFHTLRPQPSMYRRRDNCPPPETHIHTHTKNMERQKKK